MLSVKGGITPNLYKHELWFLCSVCRLLVLNNCMKFQKDILNGFHITVRTRCFHMNCYFHTGKCKSTGGYYNDLELAQFRTGVGVKWRKR